MTTPVLSNTVRIAGECRTYRIAATVAPEKDSSGALLLRTGLFHLATTRMTPKNDTKFAAKAVATPATDMIAPARAGPTARARLNSIPFSAEAAARSSLGTNSGRIACHAGVSNASPEESANVSTKSIHGDITPAILMIARINATPIIHDSVKRISLRRSTISPAEPAGRASRKYGKEAAVCVSATEIGPAPSEPINHAAPTFCMKAPASEMTSAISRLRKIVTRSGRHRFGEAVGFISLRCCLSTHYFFRTIGASSTLDRLFQPWKRERSPAFHASRSPGVLRSQSGRISLVTVRRSCQRSTTDGRPQNQ